MGVLEKVEFADLVALIITVLKDDENVRVCDDYKMTINKPSSGPVSTPNFPRVEDLFTAMSSGVSFSTLDLSHVYLQLKESSRQYVTINTHRGLYRYTRLQFVVSTRYFSKSHG